jgi:hypothetical protein
MKPENDIQFEVELKKLKLRAEHGLVYCGQVGGSGVSPEAMSKILDHLAALESACNDAPKITIGAYLGNPVWRPADEISDTEIRPTLLLALEQLEQQGILLTVLYPAEDRAVYRFIAEELMLIEIDGLHIPGMTTNFVYENFHPNPKGVIRKRSLQFLAFFFGNKDEDFEEIYMTQAMNADLTWRHFRDAFHRFVLDRVQMVSIDIKGKVGTVTLKIDFKGYLQGEPEPLRFVGEGKFVLNGRRNWWELAQVHWPAQQA